MDSVFGQVYKTGAFQAMTFDLKAAMTHKPPMLLIDEVKEAGDNYVVTAFNVRPDNIFLDGDVLAVEALAEIMAQSVAAFNAHKAWKNNVPPEKGFLVGLKNVIFSGEAAIGDSLSCRIDITDFISQTYIAACSVAKAGKIIAAGEIRIYAWN